jgi:hypothetical protein
MSTEVVAELRQIGKQLVTEATSAANALALVARAQYHHAEVARLHIAIGLLKERLDKAHEETCHFGRDAECDCGKPAFTHCRMCGHVEVSK